MNSKRLQMPVNTIYPAKLSISIDRERHYMIKANLNTMYKFSPIEGVRRKSSTQRG